MPTRLPHFGVMRLPPRYARSIQAYRLLRDLHHSADRLHRQATAAVRSIDTDLTWAPSPMLKRYRFEFDAVARALGRLSRLTAHTIATIHQRIEEDN